MTAAPPQPLFGWPVVTAALPRPAVVAVSLPTMTRRLRAVAPAPGHPAAPPPAPAVVHLAARPQGPVRLAFPAGHPLRNPLLYQQATAARG